MGAKYYDDALLKKLQKWTEGANVTITGVNDTQRLFEVVSDKSGDKPIQLPLITLSRNGGYTILNTQKQPKTFSGYQTGKSVNSTISLNVIPIQLEYKIDIYTRYFHEADEYARNFIFNIINYPQLDIDIPYENGDLHHYGNIRISTEIEDNSDIPERIIPGQFSRLTIGLNIDDAYLFDVRTRNNWKIVELSAQIDDMQPRELLAEFTFDDKKSVGKQ